MTYAATQSSAKRLLASKGQPVTISAPTTGAYDPATASATIATVVVETVGVVLPLSRGLTHMPGTDIENGDKQILLPGDIDLPPLGSTVTVGGVDYVLKEAKPLDPAGTPVLFDCIIRGAA